jgi:aminoglycoside 3-N-acetyltransferase
MINAQTSLSQDLRALGVESGGVLFVHSSFKSLGEVEGGAATVIAALEETLGEKGTLLMPSFNLVAGNQLERAATWNAQSTPTSTGYLTEFFRLMPGTRRSDHPSHAVAARGELAQWITQDHRSQRGPNSPWDISPWGKTYGVDSPLVRALETNAQVLMLGTNYDTLTYLHLVEVLEHAQRAKSNVGAKFWMLERTNCGHWWDANGVLKRGRVGEAECRLFRVRGFVENMLAQVTKTPIDFFRWMEK